MDGGARDLPVGKAEDRHALLPRPTNLQSSVTQKGRASETQKSRDFAQNANWESRRNQYAIVRKPP
eukprot:3262640-Amphidinium_carterae.1